MYRVRARRRHATGKCPGSPDTGKKTPGGAGTHTGHTGHTGARGQTDHTDEPDTGTVVFFFTGPEKPRNVPVLGGSKSAQAAFSDGGNYRVDSPPAVLSRPRLPRSSACRNPRLPKPSVPTPTSTPGSATAQRSFTATSATCATVATVATVASSALSANVGVRCHCGWRRRHLCWCRRQPRAVPDLGRLRGAVAQWQPRVSFTHNRHMQQHFCVAEAAEWARQVLSGRRLSCRPSNHVGRLRLLPRLKQGLGCESLRRPHHMREWPHCQLRHVFKQRAY